MKLILTCEHAGNEIPGEFKDLFKNALPVLDTHRGYDPGALDMFENLLPLANFGIAHRTSRLLIELNRSLHHPKLFSEFSGGLTKNEKDSIINTLYFPYRDRVEAAICNLIDKREKVLHLSIHSFTPVLDGVERNTDIGLLYDPTRKEEKDVCKVFKKHINEIAPSLKLRYNYPYLGKADGFTTYLRRKFPSGYVGIELEINQKFAENNVMAPSVKNAVYLVVKDLL